MTHTISMTSPKSFTRSKLRVAVLISAVALTACTNPGRFGSNDANGLNTGYDSSASAGIIPGSANDPSAPAYFNQTIGDRVLFLVDQSTLTPEARTILAGQAQWLIANADYTAIIEGHADEQGTREYNLALGSRRAAAVNDFLISQGVNPSRLRTVTYGKERPLAVCSSESCYSQNRRSVTVLAAGAGVS